MVSKNYLIPGHIHQGDQHRELAPTSATSYRALEADDNASILLGWHLSSPLSSYEELR
jgi:hypothetical protein